MLLPLLGVNTPIDQSTINIISKPPAIVQPAPEPTTEEKIASNYYKCNTDLQWIRADNAQCLDKTNTVAEYSQPSQVSVNGNGAIGLNGYEDGSCTGWVASHRYVPPGWGDASNWRYAAQQSGWTVSSIPVAGAIGWTYGHVVYVQSVNGDGTVTISEANYDWVRYHSRINTVPVSTYTYLY